MEKKKEGGRKRWVAVVDGFFLNLLRLGEEKREKKKLGGGGGEEVGSRSHLFFQPSSLNEGPEEGGKGGKCPGKAPSPHWSLITSLVTEKNEGGGRRGPEKKGEEGKRRKPTAVFF